MSTCSYQGPTVTFAKPSASPSTTWSRIAWSTTTREPAAQICPVFSVMLRTIVGIAFSSGASRSTTCGDLPPSSRCTGTRFSAHACMIAVPVSGDPVKLIRRMPGWCDSALPASAP